MTTTSANVSRENKRWSFNEEMQLLREYELLRLSVPEIASLHKRSEKAILFRLKKEALVADTNVLEEEDEDSDDPNDSDYVFEEDEEDEEDDEDEEEEDEQDDNLSLRKKNVRLEAQNAYLLEKMQAKNNNKKRPSLYKSIREKACV